MPVDSTYSKRKEPSVDIEGEVKSAPNKSSLRKPKRMWNGAQLLRAGERESIPRGLKGLHEPKRKKKVWEGRGKEKQGSLSYGWG
jgi:hypothetical protein